MGGDLLWGGIGLFLLVLGGEFLVRGAVNMSLRLGIPALIVSLTVVAFGTSAPELLVSVLAVLDGVPGIALGNVVGSNIANILLILGIPAIISTITTKDHDTTKSYLMMVAATLLFILLSFLGPIRWWHALILLAGLALMLADSIRDSLAHRAGRTEDELEGADPQMRWWRIVLYLVLGLIGLPLGANFLVDSATNIARAIGVSETVIGLTLVAVGTSLPELATSVAAALKGRADVAMGNVIGSNMFNLLAIIGVAGLVGPLPVPDSLLRFDLWVMLAAALLLAPFAIRGWKITRTWGGLLTAAYVGYVVAVLTWGT